MTERSNVLVLKTSVGETSPRVRIPPPPPDYAKGLRLAGQIADTKASYGGPDVDERSERSPGDQSSYTEVSSGEPVIDERSERSLEASLYSDSLESLSLRHKIHTRCGMYTF